MTDTVDALRRAARTRLAERSDSPDLDAQRLLEQVLGGFTEYWQFLLGIALIVIVLMGSGGIAGLFERSGARKGPAHG